MSPRFWHHSDGGALLLPSVPISGNGHEPVGFTQITSRPFNAVTPDGNTVTEGWTDFVSGATNLTVITDATAPKSPSNVAQLRYPAGFTGGGDSPGGSEIAFSGGPYNKCYTSHWVKLSSNWQGHDSTVNKQYHMWIDGVNKVVFSATGAGAGTLQPQMRLQGLSGNYNPSTQGPAGGSQDANCPPNVAPNTGYLFDRNTWYRVEILCEGGTAGQANGTCNFWLNDTHLGDYSNIPWATTTATFTLMKWDPTWGGTGGINVTNDMWMWMDHFYISGGN